MEVYTVLCVCITFTLLCGVQCTADMELLNDRLDILSNRLDTFETQMSIEKAVLINKQEDKLLSLKTELKTNIRQHVTEALSDILRSESFEDMIKSQVISEIRHLQRTNHQMKRELHQMKKSLGRVQKDNQIYREALQKGETAKSELMTCSKYLVKSELLTAQLAQSNRQIRELEQKLGEQSDSCSPSNNTSNKDTDSVIECSKCLYSEIMNNRLIKYDFQISELNQALTTENKSCKNSKKTINEETDSASETTTPTSSTASSTTDVVETTPPTRLTTSEPQPERSRILIAPLSSSAHRQFRQVDKHSNTLDIYSYLYLKEVRSVLYISKLNSLLVGLYEPKKIFSSTLHSTMVRTVRHNVITHGMAADEKIGVVFLSTYHPSFTISRMSLQGKDFTALVSLSGYGHYPRGISVYPERKIIYGCNFNKLFSVRYDGSGLTTLTTGRTMYAVTLDISNGLLYYGKEKKLMKMPLSTNTSSDVTQFSFYIWNLIYYRDTVYYISYNKSPGTLGAVDVGQNIVSNTLQTVKVSAKTFAICLIP